MGDSFRAVINTLKLFGACLGLVLTSPPSLAWAELYMLIAEIVSRYDLSFDAAAYDDIKWSSDQFIIGTSGKGGLPTTVKKVEV